MIAKFNLHNYDQIIEIRDGAVIKFHCLCPSFTIRKLADAKKTGKLEECKHLKEIKKMLDKEIIKWE